LPAAACCLQRVLPATAPTPAAAAAAAAVAAAAAAAAAAATAIAYAIQEGKMFLKNQHLKK